MMGSNKVRMMTEKKEEEDKNDTEDEDATAKTLQIKSGNILAPLHHFRNACQVAYRPYTRHSGLVTSDRSACTAFNPK